VIAQRLAREQATGENNYQSSHLALALCRNTLWLVVVGGGGWWWWVVVVVVGGGGVGGGVVGCGGWWVAMRFLPSGQFFEQFTHVTVIVPLRHIKTPGPSSLPRRRQRLLGVATCTDGSLCLHLAL